MKKQSVAFAARTDVPHSDEEKLRLTAIFFGATPCLQTGLCIESAYVAIDNKRQLGRSFCKMPFENSFAMKHKLVKVRILWQRRRCGRKQMANIPFFIKGLCIFKADVFHKTFPKERFCIIQILL